MAGRTVFIPLPDRDFDVTEVAVPWKLLREAGHQIVFLTEKGDGPAAGDPKLLTGVIFGQLGADPEPKKFYAEMIASPEFLKPQAWTSLTVEGADALLLPGGHAPGMRQYLGSEELQQRVAAFFQSGKPVAAICHGVLLLARANDESGKSVLFNKKTTSLTKAQERVAYFLTAWKLGSYYRTYPEYVEDEVKALLRDPKQYQTGPVALTSRGTRENDAPAFCVTDGNYISGRWPGDAYLLAKKLLALL
jgi:putative intracellular protease/amidase